MATARSMGTLGFNLCKEERHHSFGKDRIGQTWGG